MQHANIRRELAEAIRSLFSGSEAVPQPPRPYQLEALDSMAQWLEDPGGTPRGYVQHATGLGKTVLFSLLARQAVALRILIVAPSKTLIVQTAQRIAPHVGGLIGHQSSLSEIRNENGKIVALRGSAHHSIVLTTDATLRLKGADIARDFTPHVVIRDECHWGYSKASQEALAHFRDAVIIGFSATPDYLGTVAHADYLSAQLENGQVLYGDPHRFARTHFQTCIDVRSARWGMEHGWLCPLAWAHIGFNASLDGIRIKEGPGGMDYEEGALQSLMREQWPALCDAIRRLYLADEYGLSSRQAFAVCPSVSAAHELADTLRRAGIRAACVTGETPDDERNELLRKFNRREITFLSSVIVLREGWDAPDAEVCFMLRPTKSRVYYEQGLGRVLRISPANPNKVALVVDVHFQKTKFEPLSAPILYGNPGQTLGERDIIIRPQPSAPASVKLDSPYLPSDVAPRLIVVPPITIEYRADKDGIIVKNGERWASHMALCVKFGLGPPELAALVYDWRRFPMMQARTHAGIMENFYRVSDVEASLRVSST